MSEPGDVGEESQPYVHVARNPTCNRYIVQLFRPTGHDEYQVTQTSEPMTKVAASQLAVKWGRWHRVEVR